jgi:hypothetical protein
MKLRFAVMICCELAMLSACYEPPYRYDIRGNGQGGIDIQKVPKENPAPPAPAAPPPAPSPAVDQQQRINELESRVRDLSAENEKLKRQMPTTTSVTGSGKE